MIPMIDAMLVPGAAGALLTIGPAFLGVALALVAGAVWLVAGTGEELRRIAARDWDARREEPAPPNRRLAA